MKELLKNPVNALQARQMAELPDKQWASVIQPAHEIKKIRIAHDRVILKEAQEAAQRRDVLAKRAEGMARLSRNRPPLHQTSPNLTRTEMRYMRNPPPSGHPLASTLAYCATEEDVRALRSKRVDSTVTSVVGDLQSQPEMCIPITPPTFVNGSM